MLQLLHQYLIQHRSVSLPGLGTIQLQHIPAIINFTDHLIEPPALKAFLDDTQDTPGKSLFRYMSDKLGIEEWEAIKRLNDFSFDLKNDLKQGNEVIWHDVGTLKLDMDGTLQLEAVPVSNHHMYPLPAQRIIRSDANHIILRGDTEISGSFFPENQLQEVYAPKKNRELLWVIIAALTGLALLFFYLYDTGFDFYSIFNRQ